MELVYRCQAIHCSLIAASRRSSAIAFLSKRSSIGNCKNRHHVLGHQCQAAAAASAAGELPAELKKLVTNFSMVPDAKLKYQQLLYLGKKLPPLPPSAHTEDNKVRGCVSQVWVVPEVKDGKVFWKADSDSLLTKGLAALLVQGLSNCTPEEIIQIQPEFIEQLGLGQALTPSRNNGFLNMFKLMQAKSLQLLS